MMDIIGSQPILIQRTAPCPLLPLTLNDRTDHLGFLPYLSIRASWAQWARGLCWVWKSCSILLRLPGKVWGWTLFLCAPSSALRKPGTSSACFQYPGQVSVVSSVKGPAQMAPSTIRCPSMLKKSRPRWRRTKSIETLCAIRTNRMSVADLTMCCKGRCWT